MFYLHLFYAKEHSTCNMHDKKTVKGREKSKFTQIIVDAAIKYHHFFIFLNFFPRLRLTEE